MDYNTFLKKAKIETKEVINEAIRIYSIIEDVDFAYFNRKNKTSDVEILPIAKHDKRLLSIFLSCLIKDKDVRIIFEEEGLTSESIIKSINEKNKIDINIRKNKEDLDYKYYYKTNFSYIVENLAFNSIECVIPAQLVYNSTINELISSNFVESIFIAEINEGRSFTYNEPYMQRLEDLLDPMELLSSDIYLTLENAELFDSPKSNYLEKYGTVITDKDYNFNPAIGREKEIEQIQLSLLTDEVSPILVGESGVGKTAIVEGLAYKIKNDLVSSKIANKKIVKLNVSTLVAGCQYVGMFQDRVEKVLNEAKKDKSTVLFIDEIHSAIGTGSGSSKGQDLANILKPYIDRGDVTIIGATTTKEYQEYIAEDTAFKRRFEKINVNELNKEQLIQVVSGTIEKIEKVTSVKWDENPDFKYNILSDIIDATSKEKRVYNDRVNNPDLVLKIVKKAFAYSQLEDSEKVSIKHFAKALNTTDRLYESVRKKASNKLINKYNDEKEKVQVNKLLLFPQGGRK